MCDVHVEIVSTSFQRRMVIAWCKNLDLFRAAILSRGNLEGLVYHISSFLENEVFVCMNPSWRINVIVNQNDCFVGSGLDVYCSRQGYGYEISQDFFICMAKVSKHLPLKCVVVDVSFVEYHGFYFMWCHTPSLDDFHVSSVLRSFSSMDVVPWCLRVRMLSQYLDRYFLPIIARFNPECLCFSRSEMEFMLFRRGSIMLVSADYNIPRAVIRRHGAKRRSKALMVDYVRGSDE